MKFIPLFAAAGLAIASLGAAAYAQPVRDDGMHQDMRQDTRQDIRQDTRQDMRQDMRRDDRGRGDVIEHRTEMRRDAGWRDGDHGRHNGWSRHHRHCWMEWHHHHQVRVCR